MPKINPDRSKRGRRHCYACGAFHGIAGKHYCVDCTRVAALRYFAAKQEYWKHYRSRARIKRTTVARLGAALDVLWGPIVESPSG